MNREEILAQEFELLAEALRNGEATLYGYDVNPETNDQSGGIAYSGAWVHFEFRSQKAP